MLSNLGKGLSLPSCCSMQLSTPFGGRRGRDEIASNAGLIPIRRHVLGEMLLVALAVVHELAELVATDDSRSGAGTQSNPVSGLHQLFHHRTIDDIARVAPIETVDELRADILGEEEPWRTPPIESHIRRVRQEHCGVDIWAGSAKVPFQKIGEHLGFEVCSGIRALDGAPSAALAESPVNDVTCERALMTLDLNKEEALPRQEHQVELVQATRTWVIEFVQLPRLVRIRIRDLSVDDVEGLALPWKGRRAASVDSFFGERHATAPPWISRPRRRRARRRARRLRCPRERILQRARPPSRLSQGE